MTLAYIIGILFVIPFFESCAYCMATALTLITTRLCLIDGGRAAFRGGSKLALLHCWLAVSIASAIRIFFVADDFGFLKVVVGSFVAGIFLPILRVHIVLLAWGAGLFIGSIFILFTAMPKIHGQQVPTEARFRSIKINFLDISNRQVSRRNKIGLASQFAVFAILSGCLIYLYTDPDFPNNDPGITEAFINSRW